MFLTLPVFYVLKFIQHFQYIVSKKKTVFQHIELKTLYRYTVNLKDSHSSIKVNQLKKQRSM